MTTVTPAELGQFLDAVASAPVALRDVPRINSILDRLVRLANQPHNVTGVPPSLEDMVTYQTSAAGEAERVRNAVAEGRPC